MPYKAIYLNEYSAIATGMAAVRYRAGEWAEAPEWLARKGYYLTYFEARSDAMNFIEDNSALELKLYECEVVDTVPPHHLPEMLSIVKLQAGEMVTATDLGLLTLVWPLGTWMARRIKITRRAEPWIQNRS